MKLKLHKIPIRDVAEGYVDSAEMGCRAYGGKLNIRPAFQREFIYNDKQRDEVIKTVKKKFPLNIMYWVRNSDGTFEMLDGQQRTISICQYVGGSFSLGEKNGKVSDKRSFVNLTEEEKNAILDYELSIYICEGNDKEKLDWFEVVNIAGVELTHQELRNAIYSCEWTTEAKKYFSKNNCPAQMRYGKYLKGSAIRQDFLETALKWICDSKDFKDLQDYMNIQKANGTKTAEEIWDYFEQVFAWVEKVFPKYRNEMKGLDWGILYNEYGKGEYDAEKFEAKIDKLMIDDDVTNNRGIYEYLFDGAEKHLQIRQFTTQMKRAAYEKQKHKCAKCAKEFPLEEMHADHIKPWSKGGKTIAKNCQVLCADCNRRKSNV